MGRRASLQASTLSFASLGSLGIIVPLMSNFVAFLLLAFLLPGTDRGYSLRPAVGPVLGMAVVLLVVAGLQVANADTDADADADASADQPRCHGAIDCRSPWYAVRPFVWSQFDVSSSENALTDLPESSSNPPTLTSPTNLGRCSNFAIDRENGRHCFFSLAKFGLPRRTSSHAPSWPPLSQSSVSRWHAAWRHK